MEKVKVEKKFLPTGSIIAVVGHAGQFWLCEVMGLGGARNPYIRWLDRCTENSEDDARLQYTWCVGRDILDRTTLLTEKVKFNRRPCALDKEEDARLSQLRMRFQNFPILVEPPTEKTPKTPQKPKEKKAPKRPPTPSSSSSDTPIPPKKAAKPVRKPPAKKATQKREVGTEPPQKKRKVEIVDDLAPTPSSDEEDSAPVSEEVTQPTSPPSKVKKVEKTVKTTGITSKEAKKDAALPHKKRKVQIVDDLSPAPSSDEEDSVSEEEVTQPTPPPKVKVENKKAPIQTKVVPKKDAKLPQKRRKMHVEDALSPTPSSDEEDSAPLSEEVTQPTPPPKVKMENKKAPVKTAKEVPKKDAKLPQKRRKMHVEDALSPTPSSSSEGEGEREGKRKGSALSASDDATPPTPPPKVVQKEKVVPKAAPEVAPRNDVKRKRVIEDVPQKRAKVDTAETPEPKVDLSRLQNLPVKARAPQVKEATPKKRKVGSSASTDIIVSPQPATPAPSAFVKEHAKSASTTKVTTKMKAAEKELPTTQDTDATVEARPARLHGETLKLSQYLMETDSRRVEKWIVAVEIERRKHTTHKTLLAPIATQSQPTQSQDATQETRSVASKAPPPSDRQRRTAEQIATAEKKRQAALSATKGLQTKQIWLMRVPGAEGTAKLIKSEVSRILGVHTEWIKGDIVSHRGNDIARHSIALRKEATPVVVRSLALRLCTQMQCVQTLNAVTVLYNAFDLEETQRREPKGHPDANTFLFELLRGTEAVHPYTAFTDISKVAYIDQFVLNEYDGHYVLIVTLSESEDFAGKLQEMKSKGKYALQDVGKIVMETTDPLPRTPQRNDKAYSSHVVGDTYYGPVAKQERR